MPNGIAFSPDERHIYIADTGGNWHPDESKRNLPAILGAYEVKADGTLSLEPVWETETRCDGMAVDVKGHIYTTSAAGVTVLSPKGKILGTIKTPESPANCCFGGDDFKTLYITARTSLYSVELANAGCKIPKGS